MISSGKPFPLSKAKTKQEILAPRYNDTELDHLVTYGHNKVMKTANVSELKARLSSYLAEVRKGNTVVVLDRRTPIARLIPYENTQELKITESTCAPAKLRDLKPIRLRKKMDPVKFS